MGKRILVVDDHGATRQALRELLEDEGYQVEVAVDGVEALAALDTFRPDLILSDLQMPRMTGEELLEHLCACRSSIPVVVITARPEADLGDLGVLDIISKPLDFADVLAHVARAATATIAHRDRRSADPARVVALDRRSGRHAS